MHKFWTNTNSGKACHLIHFLVFIFPGGKKKKKKVQVKRDVIRELSKEFPNFLTEINKKKVRKRSGSERQSVWGYSQALEFTSKYYFGLFGAPVF